MKITDATKIRIKELCNNRNITLNKLSLISGITQSTLNSLMKDNKGITINTIQKICDGLEITITDFFNDKIFENVEQEIE